jgi:hypothetical protein
MPFPTLSESGHCTEFMTSRFKRGPCLTLRDLEHPPVRLQHYDKQAVRRLARPSCWLCRSAAPGSHNAGGQTHLAGMPFAGSTWLAEVKSDRQCERDNVEPARIAGFRAFCQATPIRGTGSNCVTRNIVYPVMLSLRTMPERMCFPRDGNSALRCPGQRHPSRSADKFQLGCPKEMLETDRCLSKH